MFTTPQMRYDHPHFVGIPGLPEVTLLMLTGGELGFKPGSADVNVLWSLLQLMSLSWSSSSRWKLQLPSLSFSTIMINCSYNSRYSDSIGLIVKEEVTNFYVYKEQIDKGTEQSTVLLCGSAEPGGQAFWLIKRDQKADFYMKSYKC